MSGPGRHPTDAPSGQMGCDPFGLQSRGTWHIAGPVDIWLRHGAQAASSNTPPSLQLERHSRRHDRPCQRSPVQSGDQARHPPRGAFSRFRPPACPVITSSVPRRAQQAFVSTMLSSQVHRAAPPHPMKSRHSYHSSPFQWPVKVTLVACVCYILQAPPPPRPRW